MFRELLFGFICVLLICLPLGAICPNLAQRIVAFPASVALLVLSPLWWIACQTTDGVFCNDIFYEAFTWFKASAIGLIQ